MTVDTESCKPIPSPTVGEPPSLLPSDAVLRLLEDGAAFIERGELDNAAHLFARASESAADGDDRAGYGRAQAQLAALEESRGQVDKAFGHNRLAQESFLAIGDGEALVQSFRVDGFLHVRRNEHTAAAHCFAKALSLAIQFDGRLVLTTLDQVVPVANYLVEADQSTALLPLGAALAQAVESLDLVQNQEVREFAELAATVAGALAPLGVLASEPHLTDAKRRRLAARSTHQAWHVDALTKRRWELAALVKETLQSKLSFHEELD
ncbi:MAG: hypothetical protein F4Y42_10325 [Caldilineaceae bacterium SB0664_bin_27]|uniref:Tetratricopeptide repeat protein n=1 Tax=Caldilineaceae bacterium SB0664_bin_27 TaxID=2605260 RepID=A0A6B0YS33_9CHLR|nr:hypothetical protein [Caldilineaceae bacterium SB0664_bin_27]